MGDWRISRPVDTAPRSAGGGAGVRSVGSRPALGGTLDVSLGRRPKPHPRAFAASAGASHGGEHSPAALRQQWQTVDASRSSLTISVWTALAALQSNMAMLSFGLDHVLEC